MNKCEAQKISILEMQFLTTGFMHLTGVKFQKGRVAAGAFFDKCLDKRLDPEEFEMAADGTTEMKLRILPMLFRKNLSANMVGDFSARTPVLVTEKLAGGVKGCMGFVLDEETGYYAPNTVLNLDIRTYLTNQLRIVATFRKNIHICQNCLMTVTHEGGVERNSLKIKQSAGCPDEIIIQEPALCFIGIFRFTQPEH